jgi:hypothetical protein
VSVAVNIQRWICHFPFAALHFFLDLPAAAQSETLLAARTSKTFFSSLRLSA